LAEVGDLTLLKAGRGVQLRLVHIRIERVLLRGSSRPAVKV
jgi:hypothetical protein